MQRVTVTGHNRESATRVIHYLRPAQPVAGAPLELHGALYVSDEKNILADGTEFDITLSITSFAQVAATPVAGPATNG